MRQFAVSVILLCLTVFVSKTVGSANVHVENALIVDDAGRVRLYHGVNYVNKGFPWYPQELLDRSNVAALAQIGLNFVRVGYCSI